MTHFTSGTMSINILTTSQETKKIGRNAERKVFTVPPQQEGDTLRAVWSSESQGDAAQGVERSSRLLFLHPACLGDSKSL